MKQKLLKILYKFFALCARIYLWRTKPFVIGITGSVWKTCCRDIVTQVLKETLPQAFSKRGELTNRVYTSPKNYNSELGLVFSIFQIEEYNPGVKNLLKLSWEIFKKSLLQKKQYDILVAEYGIDSSGDMDFLLTIMKPDISILTKLDSVHSDNFDRGITELWEDKFKLLLSGRQKVYFNAQDEFSLQHQKLLSKSPDTMFIKNIKTQLRTSDGGLEQVFLYNKKQISINLLWDENIEYTILWLKIAQELGVKLTQENYVFNYVLQAGRFSIFERNENIFIDSSYNAGPESMKKIIGNTKLVQRELYPEHKIIYVLWDMREIGESRQSAHINIAWLVKDAHGVILIGPDMYSYALREIKKNNFQGDIHSTLSSHEAWKYLKKYLQDNSDTKYIILFKGSQNTIFTEEALAPQLTVSQRKNIPRQSEDWKSKKNEFFRSL